jgi:hypothetical protein
MRALLAAAALALLLCLASVVGAAPLPRRRLVGYVTKDGEPTPTPAPGVAPWTSYVPGEAGAEAPPPPWAAYVPGEAGAGAGATLPASGRRRR